MLYLKIMGSEDMPDHDPSKPHTMMEVSEYRTGQNAFGELFIDFQYAGGHDSRRVFSNIYVMNADGKTIGTISPAPGVPQ